MENIHKQELIQALKKLIIQNRYNDPIIMARTTELEMELKADMQKEYGHLIGRTAIRKKSYLSQRPERPCTITDLSHYVGSNDFSVRVTYSSWHNPVNNRYECEGFDHMLLSDLKDLDMSKPKEDIDEVQCDNCCRPLEAGKCLICG